MAVVRTTGRFMTRSDIEIRLRQLRRFPKPRMQSWYREVDSLLDAWIKVTK